MQRSQVRISIQLDIFNVAVVMALNITKLKKYRYCYREIFQTGVTKENYIRFFHNLLWYEETIARINLKVTYFLQ